MKICPKCNKELSYSEFGLDSRSKDKCFTYCKVCCKVIYQENKERLRESRKIWSKTYRDKSKYHIKYYLNNKERIKEKSRTYGKVNRDKIRDKQAHRKQEAVLLLGNKCNICSQTVHPAAFDFHHINPNEKEKSIKDLLNCSWSRLKVELAKCVLLCANCHREYHYNKERDELYEPVWLA